MLFRPARAADMDEICTLLATAKQTPAAVHALFMADPAFDPARIRVAWTGGRIVACAVLYPRTLRIGAATVAAAGIGNLRTDPRYWRQGLASALLGECLSSMYQDGIALAPLLSARHTLFLRRGWRPLPEVVLDVPPEALQAASNGGAAAPGQAHARARVDRLEGRDLDAVMALHESVNAARTGSPLRDRDEWLARLTVLDLLGAQLLVARRGKGVAGYAAALPRNGQARGGTGSPVVEVVDLLLAPWAEDAWLPLLRAAQDAGGKDARLRLDLPGDYRRLVRDGLGPSVVEETRDDLMMRVVDPFALLRGLAPLLSSRLRDTPAATALRVRVGPLRGGAVLCASGPMVSVERPRRDDVDVLPDDLFLHLLFGVEDAHLMIEQAPLPEAARETLARLFPLQDWVYWRADAL